MEFTFTTIEWLVAIAHVLVWSWYLPWMWNTSERSRTELRLLRQRQYGKPQYLWPVEVRDNLFRYSVLRTLIWSVALCVLARNYLYSHHDWQAAVFVFLLPSMLGVEAALQWRRRRYDYKKTNEAEGETLSGDVV